MKQVLVFSQICDDWFGRIKVKTCFCSLVASGGALINILSPFNIISIFIQFMLALIQ